MTKAQTLDLFSIRGGNLMEAVMTITQLRQALREKFGGRRYRITHDGAVHVHGTMPNTNQVGWYFLGYVGTPELESRL